VIGATKRRAYNSAARESAAAATRDAILEAARHLFLSRGYAGTTMPAIAAAAGVALDTVYAAVGKKPKLFRLLVEVAISGRGDAVPAQERDYVRALRSEPDARSKLKIYAAAIGVIQPRLAPLFRVLQSAASTEPELEALWREVSERRAANMRLFVENLASTGRLRENLTVGVAADIIWSMNSPEFYLLLVEQRGWSPQAFESWLEDAWSRLLLQS
jgi:AcrR family transcriptional regulator